jgi:hypothetical protein
LCILEHQKEIAVRRLRVKSGKADDADPRVSLQRRAHTIRSSCLPSFPYYRVTQLRADFFLLVAAYATRVTADQEEH